MKTINVYNNFDLSRMPLEAVRAILNVGSFYQNAYGELFVVMLGSGRFNVWDVTGGKSLGAGDIEGKSADEILRLIDARTGEWTQGFVHCSDCGTKMRRFSKDIAGRYFAGCYCVDCWNRTWKEIEAKETYE